MQDTYTYVEVYDDGSIVLTEYLNGKPTQMVGFNSWTEAFDNNEWFAHDYPIHVNLDVFNSRGLSISSDGEII